ncbi:MAG: (Fe-S)-binding protein [Chloroflexota bacterium]
MNALKDTISKYRVWYCLDCGKCASVCPITLWETRAHASPRLLIERAIQGQVENVMDDYLFWACLTCKRCTELCPSDVHFSEFLRDARVLARGEGRCGECTHSEMMQTLGRMMADPDLKQNRLGWLRDDLATSEDSDTIYFVGCLPYYDPMFKNIGVEGIEIAQAAVKILNRLGIQPQVLADERCCGHDQLWQGNIDNFQALANLNMERLKASGAKRIVTTCPECARTLKIDYPQYVGGHGLEVMHLTELLAEKGLDFSNIVPAGARVTYQDPCRLGRHLGVYDAPRQAIAGLGYELVEMRRHAGSSLCCGTTCWSSCGRVSKNIQVERLEEARATGAELLVTACQKCQIHFKCAQNDPLLGEELSIPIRDLTTLIAERWPADSLTTDHATTPEVSLGD